MSLLQGMLLILLLAGAIGFALYNEQAVALRFPFGWTAGPLPLFLWAFLAFALGLVLSGVRGLWAGMRLKSRARRLKKRVEELAGRREGPLP